MQLLERPAKQVEISKVALKGTLQVMDARALLPLAKQVASSLREKLCFGSRITLPISIGIPG